MASGAPTYAASSTSRPGSPRWTAILQASRRVATRLPGQATHRDLSPRDDADEGDVRVVVADSVSQESALVADELRRAHLLDGVPWSRMAVLVRSAVRQVPVLRRALAVAGVPVVVAGDEVPLQQEPAVRPLLVLLRAALKRGHLDGDPDGGADGDPDGGSAGRADGHLDENVADDLLTGPLGGAEALAMRRLKRALGDLENLP